MSQQSSKKRAGIAGMKALIATASVAATIAGWAILPANDPASAAGTGTTGATSQPPSLNVPGSDPFQGFSNNGNSNNNSNQVAPDNSLPQVQAPQGFSRSPFTRTHSSR